MPATAEAPKTYVIPGKGGDQEPYKIQFHRRLAERFGDQRNVHMVHWQDPTRGTLDERLDGFLTVVRGDLQAGVPVRLIGTSGGGSFAVNALYAEPGIDRVVTLGMRANKGNFPGHTTFEELAEEVPLMGESIDRMVAATPSTPIEVRRRVLTVITRGDPVVATRAAFLDGATILVPDTRVASHEQAIWEATLPPTIDRVQEYLDTGTLSVHTSC